MLLHYQYYQVSQKALQMKKHFLFSLLLVVLCCTNVLQAQVTPVFPPADSSCGASISNIDAPAANECVDGAYTATFTPSSLPNNEFAISDPSQLVGADPADPATVDNQPLLVGTSTSATFDPVADYGFAPESEFCVTGVAYDLAQVQTIVDALLNECAAVVFGSCFLSCCDAISSQTGIDVCGGLSAAGITGGSDINSLSDVIVLIDALGGNQSVQGVYDALIELNNTDISAAPQCVGGQTPVCFAVSSTVCYTTGPCGVPGCTDTGACNYDPLATIDDSSCEYISCAGCTDPSACNYDVNALINDGSCDLVSCYGCTDANACNYDPTASFDDGNCEFSTCAGCTDAAAHNYDNTATIEDNNCETCSDGILNGDEVAIDCGGTNPNCPACPTGCTDATAHNYDANAIVDDSSCETCSDGMMNGDETGIDCGGANPNCPICAVTGCTDSAACNYNPNANTDDGSCEFDSCVGCTDATAHNYDMNATIDDSSCETCTDGIMNGDEVGIDCGGTNPNCPACPTGCTDATAHNYDANAIVDDNSCTTCTDGLLNGDEVGIDCGGTNPNCPVCPTGCTNSLAINYDPAAIVDDGSCVLPTTGCTNVLACNYNPNANTDDGSCEFDSCVGCTDATAHNYDVDATVDDNSCETCTDGMMNGDETGIDCGGTNPNCPACATGCTDATAHNYNANAIIDDGNCETCTDGMMNGDEAGVDCGGTNPNCPACVTGCTDATAHNYDANAIIDDGNCETCTDGMMNGDETGIDCGGTNPNCPTCTVTGCTDSAACNYNPNATTNDGSCEFTSCVGCTNTAAHNYNANATVDDGNCETCTDGMMNGDEAGIDCGGTNPNCPACATGCTDATAHNYDANASIDDGNCETCFDGILNGDEMAVDCGGTNASCPACAMGCTDATATNYDANAVIDDGSCMYAVGGCTDPAATNYDPSATTNDGSCMYEACTDATAINYTPPSANIITDNSLCVYNTAGCSNFMATTTQTSPATGGISSPVYYDSYEIVISGGTYAFDYDWELEGYVRYDIDYNPMANEAVISLVVADNASFALTITDAAGCVQIVDSNVEMQTLNLDIIDYTITPDNGTASGTVNISVAGGTAPYTYDWSNGSTAEDIAGVISGWYAVMVTDAAGDSTVGWYWVPKQTRGRGKLSNVALTSQPNPFETTTTIAFSVEETTATTVEVFNVAGMRVAMLFNDIAVANMPYATTFDATALNAGVYIVKVTTANGEVAYQKLLMSK